MPDYKKSVLTLNVGSSSVKFSVYGIAEELNLICVGSMQPKKGKGHSIELNYVDGRKIVHDDLDVMNASIEDALIAWIAKQEFSECIVAAGHRIVFGLNHVTPEIITTTLLAQLKLFVAYDTEHLEKELRMIEACQKQFPKWMLVACYDTGFHSEMPEVAKMLPIPRRYFEKGIRRYGFHGLSFSYLMEELQNIVGSEKTKGRIILAHLGSGASLAAVKDGKCTDTSMGFTPASGLVMSSRTGDLDPGVAWYLMEREKLNSYQFNKFINHESGLLGVSETSGSIQELLKLETTDKRAAQAVQLFCYQVKKWIGSFTAVLNGLDILVFSGGIGENSSEVRERICKGLSFLGLAIDVDENKKNAMVISTPTSKVLVLVIKTNEELTIAKLTSQFYVHPLQTNGV